MSDSTVNDSIRDRYWNEFEQRSREWRFKAVKACRYWQYRLSRWLGVSAGLAVLQAAYVISLIVVAAIPLTLVVLNLAFRTEPEDGQPDAPSLSSATAVAQSICAVIIGVYKGRTSGMLVSGKHEMNRRKAVRELLEQIVQARAIDAGRLDGGPKAYLEKVCRCVGWDAQEFFQLPDDEVSCVILQHDPDDGEIKGGTLQCIARDKPGDENNWSHRVRPAYESYVFEAIRKRKAVVFHDVTDGWFQSFFRDTGKREYKSVLALPLARPGEDQPFGVLALNLRPSYVFVGRGNQMDRRLWAYAQMVNLFMPPLAAKEGVGS